VSQVEWVEVRGKDVDIAVAAAIQELGLDGPDAVDIEVLQQPERGFLGMGGQDAIVRVKAKQQDTSRRRRGGRGRGRSRDGSESGNGSSNGGNGGGRAKKEPGTGSGGRSGGQSRDSKPRESGERAPRKRSEGASQRPPRPEKDERTPKKEHTVEVEADRAEQATMVEEFLTGLLGAFGLEGNVSCTIEDDIIIADVSGEQTEALVGPKGVILQSILELSRTIVQRKSQAGARIRLDIAGYGERRREALRIYTGRLVEKILAEGGEIMLEPMNPADRKVVHDAAAELGGVRTFSEGEEPRRSVVIAKEE
jgi:spoIIIJ-associated protein